MVCLLPAITGSNDRSKILPDTSAASMAVNHCIHPI